MSILRAFILAIILGINLPLIAQNVNIVSKNNQAAENERYRDKDFYILDISEMTIEGASSIVITFSTPIASGQDFGNTIAVYKNSTANYVDGLWEISKNRQEIYFKYLDPNTNYIVRIENPGKIKNIFGKGVQNYSRTYETRITTRDFQPMVGFASSSSLLPVDFTEGIPVATLNVKNIDVDFVRIDLQILPKILDYMFGKSSSYAYLLDQSLKNGAELVYSGNFNLNAKKNVRETVTLPIKNIKELQKEGVYIAIIKQQFGKYDAFSLPATIFTVTDIGIIAHKTNNGYEIFTQNLFGNAMPHVNIKTIGTNGKVVAEQQTNDKGYLKLQTSTATTPAVLMAQKNGKISFVYLNKGALDLSEFSISGAQNFDKTLFAFGPRDLYRSGENVLVNAILRDADGKSISDRPIKVDIIQADNKIAKTFTWRGNEGFYQYTYELPENAPSGEWKFRFDLGDKNQRFYVFRVEDFMPEKIAIESTGNDEPLSRTQNAVFDIYGKYLYGAPASGNKLIGSIYMRALRNAVTSLPGFYFGSVKEYDLNQYVGYADTALDDDGKARVIAQNSWNNINSPINVVFEASLMESGGRPITRTLTQAVWPNKRLPAIKPNFSTKKVYNYKNQRYENEFSVDEDSRAEFEIIFTDKNGERLEKNNLQVTLIKERRDYYWYFSDDWHYDYYQKDIPVESIDVSVQKGKSAIVGFDVEWGSYVVEVVDKETNAVSSIRFWAGYSWQDSSDRSGVRPEQIKLKIDKPSYKAGDKAKVTIESAESGNGYLTVETNNGILWWQNIHVDKNNNIIEIPVSKEWASHDIYISATIIKEGNKNIHVTPKRAIGLLHLPLFRDDRKVDVTLKVPESIEPKEKVKILVKANLNQKQKNKKFTAVVSAVDSGILSITNFQTPDPFRAFFAKRGWGVDIYDIYGNLIEGGGKQASLKFGGDTALSKAGKKPLTTILLVAMQSKPVTLDKNGEAEVEFEIPDFNGELRFMTQIWSDEDYGSDEQKVVVAAPLVVELNHPRFLAGGDKSTFALDINNLSGLEQNLKISVSAMGYLDGFVEEKILIADKQKKVIYIPVSAKNGFGTGTVSVKVSSNDGKFQKAIEKKWTIGVRQPYPASTFGLFRKLEKDNIIRSRDFESGYKNLDERTIDARVAISSIPPINFAQAVEELLTYPYGCVEQTTSGIYPSIYASSEQLKSLGIKTSSDEERKKNVEKGIERLLGMQKPNGSFGFWSSDSEEAQWATVYVTDFLLRAKEQGYYVPQEALKKAIERLQYYSNTPSGIDYGYTYSLGYIDFAVKSYAAFVLAREHKANLGNLRRLHDLSNLNTKSPLALAQLGIALKLMGDNGDVDNLLKKALLFGTKRDWNWYGDYGSDIRDKALILSLLYEYDLLPDERTEIILSLSEQIKTRSYFSTQEKNAIFLAGRHFVNSKEPVWEAIIDANGKKEYVKSDDKPFVKTFNFTELNAIQSIKNNKDRTIFTSIDIIGYPKSAPTPVSNNITITRTYYTLDGKKTTLKELKSGDLIIVVLHVTTDLDRLPDALVVDLLPAGLELENQNLGHSSVSLDNTEALNSNWDLMNSISATDIKHQEFRDDRYVAAINVGRYYPATLAYLARAVSPGVYTVPPPYAESMYSPEFFAIGQSVSKFTVK